MKNFLPIAAAVATVFTVAPVAEASTMAAHERLVDALKSKGVSIVLNPPECKLASYAGYYRDAIRKIVICQTHGIDGSYKQAGWTANDLDTLRHEAHHVAQSCIGQGIGNNTLGTIYVKPFLFAEQYFGTYQINNIISVYKDRGASDHVAVLEVEAFAVAEMNNPDEQIRTLNKYCL
jgi:hypothetical protein